MKTAAKITKDLFVTVMVKDPVNTQTQQKIKNLHEYQRCMRRTFGWTSLVSRGTVHMVSGPAWNKAAPSRRLQRVVDISLWDFSISMI